MAVEVLSIQGGVVSPIICRGMQGSAIVKLHIQGSFILTYLQVTARLYSYSMCFLQGSIY